MALGKNLKRKKLISEEEKPSKKKEKKVVPKKKELIPKAKATSKKKTVTKKKATPTKKATSTKKVTVSKAKPVVTPPIEEKELPVVEKKVHVEEKKQPVIDPTLPLYIANELREKKDQLRKQYAEEISQIQDQKIQFVSFQVGSELYAIDIDRIKEIVQVPKLSLTPNTPDHIKGIANVRGDTYVVFDLGVRFHVVDESEPKFLLIISHESVKAGLLLAFLPSTFKAEGKSISSDIGMIEDASLDVSYIKGIIQQEEKLIYYLDIVEMLKNDKAMVVPDQMLMKEGE